MSRDPISADDAELLQRFERVRDQDAFAELVRRHGPMVLATARRVLKRTEDVEDALQATMFALAKAAGRLQEMPNVAGWLHKVAYTCAAEHRRMNARWVRKQERAMERQADVGTEGDCTGDPSISIAHEELENIVDEELLRLSAKLREAIVLCDLEGLPQKDVARKLSVPTSTVHDRLVKGRKQLHSRLVSRGATLTVAGVALPGLSGKISAAITQETVDDITAKATLFASGKTSQIGVSSTVMELANAPLATAKVKAVITLLAACVIIAGGGLLQALVMQRTILGSATGTAAGTVFVDDFADGNVKDDSPVSWIPAFDIGSLEVVEESLILTGSESTFALISSQLTDNVFGDTSMRTQVRLLEGNEIGIGVRYDDTLGLSYGCSLFANRVVTIGIGGDRYETLSETSVDFDVTSEDVMLQLDVIGDTINFWAWPADTSKPPEPTLTARDRSVPDGKVFLFVSARTASGTAFRFLPGPAVEGAFRFVHVASTSIEDGTMEGVTE